MAISLKPALTTFPAQQGHPTPRFLVAGEAVQSCPQTSQCHQILICMPIVTRSGARGRFFVGCQISSNFGHFTAMLFALISFRYSEIIYGVCKLKVRGGRICYWLLPDIFRVIERPLGAVMLLKRKFIIIVIKGGPRVNHRARIFKGLPAAQFCLQRRI